MSDGCGRKIGPFDCCTVVEGDCLELIREVPYDLALISDPPYGINLNTNYATAQRGSRRDWPRIHGDDRPFDPRPFLNFKTVLLFGANHFAERLPSSPGWIVWYKRLGHDRNDQADCEIAWTNVHRPARVFHHVWNGFLRDSEKGTERVHPTQKPVALMDWVLRELTKDTDRIVDPFAGSGTTLVAAKKLGRHFVGFEIVAEYCQAARERIEAATKQSSLFDPVAEQVPLIPY